MHSPSTRISEYAAWSAYRHSHNYHSRWNNANLAWLALDRPTCVHSRFNAVLVILASSAPAGRCSSARMLMCTRASREASHSFHIFTDFAVDGLRQRSSARNYSGNNLGVSVTRMSCQWYAVFFHFDLPPLHWYLVWRFWRTRTGCQVFFDFRLPVVSR